MDDDEIVLPTDFSAVTDADLTELSDLAREAATPLAARVSAGEDLTDDEVGRLERLSDVVQGVAAERSRRYSATTEAAVRQRRARTAAGVFAGTDEPAPAEPVEPAEPATAPSVAQVAATGATVDAPAVEVEQPQHYATLTAAAGAIGHTPGHEFSGFAEIGEAIEEVFRSFSGLPADTVESRPVLAVRRNYPDRLRITGQERPGELADKLDAVTRVAGLPGGALTAAAGWCAPSPILYDLFEVEDGSDGLADFPEMQADRGGFQYTAGPDFSSIWGGLATAAGYWHQTETQVTAARVKPTMSVACPAFTNTRLEVDGVSITGAFLQDRGYPELVARFARGAMVVHSRRLNAFKLNVVTDGSTLVDLTGANWPVTTVENHDLTTLSRLLAAYGIQAMDYRYRYRMRRDAMLEAILPYWVLEYVRADVQRRTNLDPDRAFAFAMEQLTRYFAVRNIRLQLVYDWQDYFNAPTNVLQWSNAVDGTARFTVNTTTTVGQSTGPIYTLPTTVYGLLYAAGTWVAAVSPIIRLDAVYDSTNLGLNQYNKLYVESGCAMLKRGYESRLIKATIEPSGTTSATTPMTV